MKKDTTIKKVKIKSVPLTDFSEKRFIDFFKVIKDFTRVKYNGTTIFIDPLGEYKYIEMWKDNIGIILNAEDRFYTEPNYCVDLLNGRISDNRRFYYTGSINVKLLPGDCEDIRDLFTKKKIYEVLDEYLDILKDYKKVLKTPMPSNTVTELKKSPRRKSQSRTSNKTSKNTSTRTSKKPYRKNTNRKNSSKKQEKKPSEI